MESDEQGQCYDSMQCFTCGRAKMYRRSGLAKTCFAPATNSPQEGAAICRKDAKTITKRSSVLRIDECPRDILGLNPAEAAEMLKCAVPGSVERNKILEILSSCGAVDQFAWYFPCHDWEAAGTLESNSTWLYHIANAAKDDSSSFAVEHIIIDSQKDDSSLSDRMTANARNFEDNWVMSRFIQVAEKLSKHGNTDSTVQVHCIVNRPRLAPREHTGDFGFGPVGPGHLSLYGTLENLDSFRYAASDYPCHMHRRWYIAPITAPDTTPDQLDQHARSLVAQISNNYLEEGQRGWKQSVDLSMKVSGPKDLKSSMETQLCTAVEAAWNELESRPWPYKPDPLPRFFVESS